MANKTYLVKQRRKFNGDVTVASFTIDCEESELQSIVDKLEGHITVLEANTTLSSAADASDVVTGGLPIDSISMVHSEAKTQYVGSYSKPLLFKSTVSVVELQNMFLNFKPFTGAYETEKPDAVYPKVGNIGNL